MKIYLQSSRRAALLAALLCAALASGCAGPQQTYKCADPAFTVHYPAAWSQSVSPGPYGPITVFAPKADSAPDHAQIMLQTTSASVQADIRSGNAAPPKLSIDQDLGKQRDGTLGHRWFLALTPYGIVIEAYARPDEFATIKTLAAGMAKEIRAQVHEAASNAPSTTTPKPGAKGTYEIPYRNQRIYLPRH
jgi:hypothetical protein